LETKNSATLNLQEGHSIKPEMVSVLGTHMMHGIGIMG
jgi:hypothetical protein